VVCGAAPDDETFEDARVVRGREEAGWSAHVGGDYMRLVQPEGLKNPNDKVSQRLRSAYVRTTLRETKSRNIHGNDRPER
jgi:hypothetical protein